MAGECVDIIIPTKDRAMQLHMLLESMGHKLKNMGKIVVSWQGSNNEFVEGYKLLGERVLNDKTFSSLRTNCNGIDFVQRYSLPEVYNAITYLGKSDYIMPLVDDDLFVHPYDLVNAEASRYFFEHKDVHCCAIRLGDNLSNQLPLFERKVNHKSCFEHTASLISIAKPRFLYPNTKGKFSFEEGKKDYILYNWIDNQNAIHWNITASVTGYIYAKEKYIKWFNEYGKESFLNIEGKAGAELLREALRQRGLPVLTLKLFDYLQKKFLKKFFHVYEQDVLVQLGLRLKGIDKQKNHKVRIADKIVTPFTSVCVNLCISSHQENLEMHILPFFNTEYLNGLVLDIIFFSNIKFRFPVELLREKKEFYKSKMVAYV